MIEKTRSKRRVTEKMREARNVVDTFIVKNTYPPSYREVAKLLDLVSVNTAYHRLRGYRHKMIKQTKPSKK